MLIKLYVLFMKLNKYALYIIFFTFLLPQEYNRLHYNFIDQTTNIDSHLNYSIPSFESDDFKHGLLINYTYKNSLVDYSQFFYDKNNVLFLYSHNNTINENLDLSFSLYIENTKDNPRENHFLYWNDSHYGLSTDIEKGYVFYNDDNFFIILI